MERPLCPLCKTNHFAREAHDFKEKKEGRIKSTGSDRVEVHDTQTIGKRDPAILDRATSLAESGGEAKADKGIVEGVRFDRRAYQREYMRRRRASKKGVK